MKIRAGVFFGGKSVEHEVSVISAMQTIAALDREKYEVVPVYITKDNAFYTGEHLGSMETWRDIPAAIQAAQQVVPAFVGGRSVLLRWPAPRFGAREVCALDVAIPVVHGTGVEDGALQGFFEYLGVPYTGCDVASSAAGMDKWMMKCLFRAAGLPVADGVRLTAGQFYADPQGQLARVEAALGWPVIVKPVNLGSSVGIGKARSRAELEQKITDALTYAPVVLCEKAVQNLREINCAVLGDRDGVRASVCEEPLNATDFLTYADKYQSGGGKQGAKGAPAGAKTGGAGMQSLSRRVPAELSPELSAQAQELAKNAFLAVDASGMSRIDLLLDDADKTLYVNEINTIPGSLAFYLWEASGLHFSELLDEMIALALKRSREQSALTHSFDVNLLASAQLGGKSGAKR